jgi:hypothetical protein
MPTDVQLGIRDLREWDAITQVMGTDPDRDFLRGNRVADRSA